MDGRLAGMPETVRAVAALRQATPEASLAELAAELDLPRGRVQRALGRIEEAALQPAATDGAAQRSAWPPARAERPGHYGPPASGARSAPMA